MTCWKFLQKNVKFLHGGSAYGADLQSEAYKAAGKAYQEVYGSLILEPFHLCQSRSRLPANYRFRDFFIFPQSKKSSDSFPLATFSFPFVPFCCFAICFIEDKI